MWYYCRSDQRHKKYTNKWHNVNEVVTIFQFEDHLTQIKYYRGYVGSNISPSSCRLANLQTMMDAGADFYREAVKQQLHMKIHGSL